MAPRYSDALPKGLRFEQTPKWIRAEVGGETIVDTRHAVLVWEPGHVVPLYAFPSADVRMDLLRPSATDEDGAGHDAPLAELWALEVAGRRHEGAAWRYADEELEDYVALEWDALDRWLEEEEEVVGHPRDPFKRVDVRRSSRHVVVRLDGELLAETHRPTLLFETHLPVRFYMPKEDVREELLAPSATKTICAYKGEASYFSVRIGEELHEDLAWFYPHPLPDNHQIEGLVAFFNERTDITVDGEELGRPQTQWSVAG
jgi:uncharacterized protein (DUF427 family)